MLVWDGNKDFVMNIYELPIIIVKYKLQENIYSVISDYFFDLTFISFVV